MKKTLVTLAALAMASVASAADVMSPGGYGNYEVADGRTYDASTYQNPTIKTDYYNEVNNTPLVIFDKGVSATFEQASGEVTFAAVEVKADGSTFTKTGDGTITIAGKEGSSDFAETNVSEGTLKIGYEGWISGPVSVESGATLEIAEASTYGNNDAYNPRALELNNGGTISGDGSLVLQGGVISATGTGNVVSVDLKQIWNVNLTVAEGGDLIFSGDLIKTADGATLVKTGAGSLIIDNTKINNEYTMQLDGGILDLSDVTSMGSLKAANNTTLILGQAIDMSGALTLGSGVTIDVSSWTGSPEEIFTGVKSISATSPVTVLFADGVTKEMTLTSVGGTVAVPEPATATLSLLALAGLAARRRRK